MNKSRKLLFAVAFGTALMLATAPHRATMHLLLNDSNDPSPRSLRADVELAGIGMSLLIRWSAREVHLL